MASVNWMKVQSATAVKAQFRHDCKDTRIATASHSNEQLDVSKTPLNYSTREGSTYADACQRYDNRVAELDGTSSHRKDRVTYVGLYIPTPKNLAPADEKAWMGQAKRIACDMLGQQNFVGMWVHKDEQHEYIDPRTKQVETSRVHAHLGFVPEVDGRLCGRKFVTRANMVKLNNALEDMSVKVFGVRFLDGTQKKSDGKVEDLKRESAKALEEGFADLERREAAVSAKEAELERREAELNKREAELRKREAALKATPAAPAKPVAATGLKKPTGKNPALRDLDWSGYDGGPQFSR